MYCFFKRALRKESSLNSVNYLNKFLFFVNYFCTLIYFNDYDIDVNTLFKAFKDGFTVKVKKIFIFKCRTQLMLNALLLD